MKKDARLALKIESELKGRLEAVADESGLGEASLVRACVEALCSYWEANGELTIPIDVVPRQELNRLRSDKPD